MTRAAELHAMVAQASATSPHLVPLLAAAAAGRLAIINVSRGASAIDLEAIDRLGRPVIALIADDDHAPSGPQGFPIAHQLLAWSSWTLVHGTAGAAEHYSLAVEAAEAVGCVCIIETSSGMAGAWARAAEAARGLRGFYGLTLLPAKGVHPVLPPLAARQ